MCTPLSIDVAFLACWTPPQVRVTLLSKCPLLLNHIMARRTAHGRRPSPLRFQRAVPAQRQDPVRRRREDTARGGCQVTHHGLRVPWSRPDHPHSRPICERGRQGRFAPRERAFPGIAAQGHQQPTEDQKVLRLGATTVSLERGEHVGYLAREACGTPQVLRSAVFWDVGCIQNTQERFFFQAF